MKSTSTIRYIWLGIAIMAFFVMASSSPECARSSDSVLGLEPLEHDWHPCSQGICRPAMRVAKRIERRRHKAARRVCNGDRECRDAEDLIKELVFAEIEADFEACRLECQHHQGGADGGQ